MAFYQYQKNDFYVTGEVISFLNQTLIENCDSKFFIIMYKLVSTACYGDITHVSNYDLIYISS